MSIILWLFVVNLGVAFGAGLYEHRIVLSRWLDRSSESRAHWNADAARRDATGRRFWAFVTTMPLTLLTLTSVFMAWRTPGDVGAWWMAAALMSLADRVLTFSYFVPTMIGLMRAPDSVEAAAKAVRWWNLNYL